jgi:hypothetical protein
MLALPTLLAGQVRIGAGVSVFDYKYWQDGPLQPGRGIAISGHFWDANQTSISMGLMYANGAAYQNEVFYRFKNSTETFSSGVQPILNHIACIELPVTGHLRLISYKDRKWTLNACAGISVLYLRMQYDFKFDQKRFETFGYNDGDKQTFLQYGYHYGLSSAYYFDRYQLFAEARVGRTKGRQPINTFYGDTRNPFFTLTAGIRYTLKEKPVIISPLEKQVREKRQIRRNKLNARYPYYSGFRTASHVSESDDYYIIGQGFYYVRKSYRPLSFSPAVGVMPYAGDGNHPGPETGLALEANSTLALRFLGIFNLRATGYAGGLLSPTLRSPSNFPVVGASTGFGVTVWRFEYTLDVGIANYYQPSLMMRNSLTYILSPYKTLIPPWSFSD